MSREPCAPRIVRQYAPDLERQLQALDMVLHTSFTVRTDARAISRLQVGHGRVRDPNNRLRMEGYAEPTPPKKHKQTSHRNSDTVTRDGRRRHARVNRVAKTAN